MANRQNDSRWLVLIGADRFAANILAGARSRGIDTLVFDPNSEATGARHATRLMTRGTGDIDGIRADVRALSRNARLVGVTTSLRDPAALRAAAQLRDEFDLAGIRPERTELLLARSAWAKALADLEIATPDSTILESADELDRFLDVHPAALIKPEAGSHGSAGIAQVRVGDPRNRDLFDEARLASDSKLVRAEAFVAGDEYSINGVVRGGSFAMLSLGRKFSMRNLRSTLPTGMAWGSPRAGSRADEEPRWNEMNRLARQACSALGLGVATGVAVNTGFDAPASRRGYALRFFYPSSHGNLEIASDAAPHPPNDAAEPESRDGRDLALPELRARVEWEKNRCFEFPNPKPRSPRVRRSGRCDP